jgi:hypothetical protein
LVGVARKDGENGARSLLQYLNTRREKTDFASVLDRLSLCLQRSGKPIISKEDVWKLEAFEKAEASRLGLDEYKMKTNEEMLAVLR